MDDVFFEINPKVVHEGIDGEVILINLECGNYYSLRGVAGFVWHMLQSHFSQAEIIDAVSTHYQQEKNTIKETLNKFFCELENEWLIRRSKEIFFSSEKTSLTEPKDLAAYDTPKIEKYTDMQDLLLIDPIHEVDESGWPARMSAIKTQA